MNIDRLLNDEVTFQSIVEAHEQKEAIIADERNQRRSRGLEALDERIEDRRLAVIRTIGNDSFTEAQKKQPLQV